MLAVGRLNLIKGFHLKSSRGLTVKDPIVQDVGRRLHVVFA